MNKFTLVRNKISTGRMSTGRGEVSTRYRARCHGGRGKISVAAKMSLAGIKMSSSGRADSTVRGKDVNSGWEDVNFRWP